MLKGVQIKGILAQILNEATKRKASEVYLAPNARPILRISHKFYNIHEAFSAEILDKLILESLTPEQQSNFKKDKELDMPGVTVEGNRFRINIIEALNGYELTARPLPNRPLSAEELRLPEHITSLVDNYHSGIILLTGSTGSGKSATIGSMILRINQNETKRIVTIEDPIEVIHESISSSISQREIGTNTHSFDAAMRSALRQHPDVIFIGEMRDATTVDAAIKASESGHLVLSTLHTINVSNTIDRILNYYPKEQHDQMRYVFSQTMSGIVSQRLVPDVTGKLMPICEVLTGTLSAKDSIRDGKDAKRNLTQIMEDSAAEYMQTFDMHLMSLVQERYIDIETALKYSDKPKDLGIKFASAGLY